MDTKPNNINHIIVVSNLAPNSNVVDCVKSLPAIKFEFFTYGQLGFNPTTHFLNPKFIKLSQLEIEMLSAELRDSQSSLNKLPKMSHQDKMARWYGAKPGDVFEVLRSDVGIDIMTDSSLGWRLVVARDLPKVKI